jgi:hypothetical protein
MRMLRIEDAQDFHCLRIDDHDPVTDLEVFIPAPCRLDVDYRLRKCCKVNRIWYDRAGRQAECDVIDFRFGGYLAEDFADPRVILRRRIECQIRVGTLCESLRLRRRHLQCAHAIRAEGHQYRIAVFGFGLNQEGIFQNLDVGESCFLQVLREFVYCESRLLRLRGLAATGGAGLAAPVVD